MYHQASTLFYHKTVQGLQHFVVQSVSTNQIDDTMAQDAERFQYFHLPRLSLSSAGTGCGVSNGPASVSALPPPRAADHVGSGRDGAGGTRRTLTFFPRM